MLSCHQQAAVFVTQDAAIACWHTQSRARPLRPDGEPNRPLTSLTVEIRELSVV